MAAKDKKAKDPENDLVAIKKIEKAFEHKVFTKRTLRELKMLRLMQHENVFKLKFHRFSHFFKKRLSESRHCFSQNPEKPSMICKKIGYFLFVKR